MYLMKLDGSKLKHREERGEAQKEDNRSGPSFGNKGRKERERKKVYKKKGKGGERCEVLILISLVSVLLLKLCPLKHI